jgi:hypothetical protein
LTAHVAGNDYFLESTLDLGTYKIIPAAPTKVKIKFKGVNTVISWKRPKTYKSFTGYKLKMAWTHDARDGVKGGKKYYDRKYDLQENKAKLSVKVRSSKNQFVFVLVNSLHSYKRIKYRENGKTKTYTLYSEATKL